MEGPKDSPMPPATAPFNPSAAPLAPSQEAAYRRKCIQLKKRLTEIETSNDASRRRIEQDRLHLQKMRLMRSILMEQIKKINQTPGKTLSRDELNRLGIGGGVAHISELVGLDAELRPDGEVLLDDSSNETEEEPEVHPLPKKTYPRKSTYNAPSLLNDPSAAGVPTRAIANPS
jgi:hypothetical protein